MKQVLKSHLQAGLIFLSVGALCVAVGVIAIIEFFQENSERFRSLTAMELLKGAVLPHIVAIAGAGLCLYGMIRIIQGTLMSQRE